MCSFNLSLCKCLYLCCVLLLMLMLLICNKHKSVRRCHQSCQLLHLPGYFTGKLYFREDECLFVVLSCSSEIREKNIVIFSKSPPPQAEPFIPALLFRLTLCCPPSHIESTECTHSHWQRGCAVLIGCRVCLLLCSRLCCSVLEIFPHGRMFSIFRESFWTGQLGLVLVRLR